MSFMKLFRSEEGSYIISVILGLGLATFFKRACAGRNCIVFRGAPMSQIKGKTYKYGDKCYVFEEEAERCSKTKKIVEFA